MHNTGVWTILDLYTGEAWVTCASVDGESTNQVSRPRGESVILKVLIFI
jgi:hypothetical protein